ncbi:MAG TPA: DUF4397 domain-containing protein [Armatimonadota bacterium]|nr:DUF4397 domain-containing protein [Armatimonadota bacterium]
MLRLNNSIRWRLACAGISTAAAMALSACGLGTGTTTVAIRIANAVPSAQGLDISITGATFVTNVQYKDVTTYGFITEGTNDFVGFQTGSSTVVVPDQTLNVTQTVQTIVAAGVPGSGTTPPMFFQFVDDNAAPPRGMVRIRVINASPDAGPVDVTFGGQTIATDVLYGMSSSYAVANAATADITAFKTGTTTPVVVRTSVELTGDHVFTILVEGQVSNSSANIVAQADV